ncbi:ATP synthase subunit I [Desulfuribacillus alkaliarsenatis]|uniref:ATP synthase subunit I n=1 Tax=Desulfuribacillus alkaliarsenatis TaxID=766136 RepID=A0A1E5G1J2_9FIRM|nr:ATP synthase subunit I [Desulfuribacillus alkaliarsenatis]OEF96774.1 hypothetical protein BHF68_06820 [Desulfuribacillus alkaliarsenatis]
MDNFHKNYKKVVVITAIIMLSVSVLWFFNPNPIYAGFVLGAAVSIINTYLLYRSVITVTEWKESDGNSLMRSSGMGWRVFFVIIAVIFADRVEGVSVFATVFGAFFAQIVAYIYFFINVYKTEYMKGGK